MARETRDGETRAARKPFLRRFGRNRRGSVSVEVALLALPFAALVFATLESCVSFAAQEMLANATDEVARLIRTGQVKGTAAINATSVRKMICDRIELTVPAGCPELFVDLRQYDSFELAAKAQVKYVTVNGKPDLDTSKEALMVTAGASMSKNMLRVFYRWPVVTNILALSMSTLAGNKTLHYATVTWQNEPFDD